MTAHELTELRQEAADLGVNLSTQKHQNAIHATRARAMDHARSQYTDSRTQAEKMTASVGDGLTIGLITLLTAVLTPLVLAGLIVAEWSRVSDGIMLFDTVGWRAGLIAAVLVVAYIVLLAVREHEQAKHGQQQQTAWSLRSTLAGVGYRLGVTENWRPRRVTTPEQAGQVIGALFWIIVLLGTAGAMSEKLLTVDGTWWQGLRSIATESSLLDLMTYAGGFLVAFGLLKASHWATRYLYEQFLRLRPEVAGEAADLTPAADAAELQYLRGAIAKRQHQLSERAAGQQPAPKAPAPQPVTMAAPVTMGANGNGNGNGNGIAGR